jgi:hypothetical protein
MTKLKLTQVAEVSMIDQFMAVMTFLESMGIETSELTSTDVASIRYKFTQIYRRVINQVSF